MSGKPHQIFPVERNDDIEKIAISESLDSQIAPEEREKEKNLEPEEIENEEDESDKATVSHRESDAVNDEDDGFKTPTSSDHRIPVITQCPPAPMKPPPPPPRQKRKASSPPRSSHPASSAEIESIFCSIAHDQDEQKIKKARTGDDKDRS